MNRGRTVLAVAAAALLAVTACGEPASTAATAPSASASPSPSPSPAPDPITLGPEVSPYSKVMVIVEENRSYAQVGSKAAPYLAKLARDYGVASNMDAGYPASCPSLAAYILLTSGDAQGICDNLSPQAHRLTGPNLFQQVALAGGQWRNYAEGAPENCSTLDLDSENFVVHHTPAAYYTSETERCAQWDVPMGSLTAGALHDAVAAGTLPQYSFVTPDNCNNMHGNDSCDGDAQNIAQAERWLRGWLEQILAGPDYRQGRLVVIVTWDEGDDTDNHILTLVISPSTRQVRATTSFSHCSTLRTTQEILRLPLLGCAAQAPSMLKPFHLDSR